MRFIVGIFITLGLLILVLVLLLRGGSPAPRRLTLTDYTHSDSVATWVMQGPITSQQTYQEIEIDVSNSNVTFTLFNGYQRDVAKSQTYPSNDDAYQNFLAALQQYNFTRGIVNADKYSEQGQCALGDRFIYTFTSDSNQLMRYWHTTCGGGTSKATTATINTLFQKQVPDYDTFLNGTVF